MAKKSKESPQDKLVYSVTHMSQTRFVGYCGGFFFSGVPAQVSYSAIPFSLSYPQRSNFRPGYPSVAGRVYPGRDVVSVEGFGDQSHVRAPAIQPVSVDVINFPTVSGNQPHQLSMQQDGVFSTFVLSRSPGGVALWSGTPVPLSNVGHISSINSDIIDKKSVSGQRNEDAILMAHRGYLLMSCPWSALTLAGVFLSVLEGVI